MTANRCWPISTVMLDDSLQTTGKDGAFVFSKLPPGKHAAGHHLTAAKPSAAT